jgi:uncharacterized protein (TIGR03083 family)
VTAIPEYSGVDYASLFRDERLALLDLLQSLGDADWQRPTPCPGWSVLDLVCHLVGDDLGLLARNRDAHFGTTPPDDLVGDEGFARWLDALQDEWVRAARRISPRVAGGLLSWSGPQVVEMLEREDPPQVAASVSWAGTDAVPRWLDHARELSEQWIHRQQIRSALGLAADVEGPIAEAVLDALRWAYPYRLAAIARDDGRIAVIEVTGAFERRWILAETDGGWSFVDEPQTPVAARMIVTTDQAWRLLTNNMPPSEQSELDLTGDRAITDVLLSTRAIIGVPNTA